MHLSNLIHISPTIGTTRSITYLHLQLRQIVNNPSHVKGSLNPGAVAQSRRLKLNRRKMSMSLRFDLTVRVVNQNNLKQIRITESNGLEMVNNIRLATLNARSVKTDLMISQKLNDHKIDNTETWLKDTPGVKAWTNKSELIQGSYKVKLHNRP